MADYSNAAGCIVLTADVVPAYVSNNTRIQWRNSGPDQPSLFGIYARLLWRGCRLQPAVPIKRSITPEYLVCLEDGKKFKSLKRHVRTQHRMTPEQYCAKWSLPADYPMVAPNYAAARSQLATQMGLGQHWRRSRRVNSA